MSQPARRIGWAAVFLAAAILTGHARDVCELSENAACQKLHPTFQLSCVKHVQLAVAACRRSKRQLRFGSHEDHCTEACRAGGLAFELDRRLRQDAIATAELSANGNTGWLADARAFWRDPAVNDGTQPDICTADELQAAMAKCESFCSTDAKRRDLEELQGLAAGKDFLPLRQPVFECPPGPVSEILSGDGKAVKERLYPPGHPRRAGDAVE